LLAAAIRDGRLSHSASSFRVTVSAAPLDAGPAFEITATLYRNKKYAEYDERANACVLEE